MALLFEKIYTKIATHADWWKDYMTEMSILVISLAATFYGENLIEQYNDAQDDIQTMTVVMNELESNTKEISEMLEYYHKHELFANALNRKFVKQENVVEDTIQQYNNFHRLLYYWTLKKKCVGYDAGIGNYATNGK